MKIQFLGAARQVTGSRYGVSINGKPILVDCGMFQERRYLDRNWAPSPIPPHEIEAVFVTHAHVDHCGLLPRLVKEGFSGPIHTTSASAELIEIVLYDSAKLQAEDAAFKAKRHRKENRKGPHPIAPLYTSEDVDRTIPLLTEAEYETPVHVSPGLTATFHDAGHILGSAMIEFEMTRDDKTRRLLFTGDIGQPNRPIINDPTVIERADYLVMESTYGSREHDVYEDTATKLARLINETFRRGGNVIIPTFAIERAQELVYQIGHLINKGEIPAMPVYLDSPMAGRVTNVFRRHRDLFDEDAWKRIDAGDNPLHFPQLNLVMSSEDSKAINSVNTPCIIMATSGMCTGGRIKHHLVHNITRPNTLILFVGYQAEGTLGRQILEGQEEVRIHGREWPVRARVDQIHGFSGHADRRMMMEWLSNFKNAPKQVFLTHGDEDSAMMFGHTIRQELGWNVYVPAAGETVELNDH